MAKIDFPTYSEGCVAIVCLSRPKATSTYGDLEQAAQEALSHSTDLHGELTIIPCPETARQKQLELEQNDGSLTELYNTATTAFKKGWHHLAVADNLTIRELEDVETEDPTLVVLQIPLEDQLGVAESTHCPTVRARRFNIPDAMNILSTSANVRIETFSRSTVGQLPRINPFSANGFLIHNPDKPLFHHHGQGDDPRWHYADAMRRALAAKPALPLEIITTIEDKVNTEIPLEELTDAPKHLPYEQSVLKIHMLASSVNVRDIEDALNEKIRQHDEDMTAVVYPWKTHLPASRRDFWKLWDRIIQENTMPDRMGACMLYSADEVEHEVVTVATWFRQCPTFVFRMKLGQFILLWRKHFLVSETEQTKDPVEKFEAVEIQHHPDSRFFDDTARWRPYGYDDDRPLLFFLISRLDQDVIEKTKDMILNVDLEYCDDAAEDAFYFPDWNEDRDGDATDMLKIAKKCYYIQGGRYSIDFILVADRQTLEDGKVIICEYNRDGEHMPDPDARVDWEDPEFEGIRYARTPVKDAWINWVMLDLSEVNWDDRFLDDDTSWLGIKTVEPLN